MRTVFDTGCGSSGAVADHLLGQESYRFIREVAAGIEEIKHIAHYMPQLYRLFELTKNLPDIIGIIERGVPIRIIFSVTINNLVEGQTVLPIAGGFLAGSEQVSIERQVLIPGIDYTVANGSVILTNGARPTDIIVINATQKKTSETPEDNGSANAADVLTFLSKLPLLPTDGTSPDVGGWFRNGDTNGFSIIYIEPKV